MKVIARWEWPEDKYDNLYKIIATEQKIDLPFYIDIVVDDVDDNGISGEYEFFNSGAGGLIYINYFKNKLIKFIPDSEAAKKEINLQKKANKYATTIYKCKESIAIENIYSVVDETIWNQLHNENITTVTSEKANNFIKSLTFYKDGDILYTMIIMEYLSPLEEWIPLAEINDRTIIEKLKEVIIYLVNEKKIYNLIDFVGYTGNHIYYNINKKVFKFIDFGQWENVNDNNNKSIIQNKMIASINERLSQELTIPLNGGNKKIKKKTKNMKKYRKFMIKKKNYIKKIKKSIKKNKKGGSYTPNTSYSSPNIEHITLLSGNNQELNNGDEVIKLNYLYLTSVFKKIIDNRKELNNINIHEHINSDKPSLKNGEIEQILWTQGKCFVKWDNSLPSEEFAYTLFKGNSLSGIDFTYFIEIYNNGHSWAIQKSKIYYD